MTGSSPSPDARSPLEIDAAATAHSILPTLRQQVVQHLRRKGVVVGLSGGVDSSVVASLCARALGSDRVLGLFMPERDSASDSLRLGRLHAESLGIETVLEPIGEVLESIGCYRHQDEAIRHVFPEYGPGYRSKITLPSVVDSERLNVMQLTVESPSGEQQTSRMPPIVFRQLVAATNYKQRVRKMVEYYHADRLGYAVAGTPNRLEYDQGFFVKQGDGAADVKPIAHLYKTQVYALAEHLGVDEEIRSRPPTTDTYSLEQTQEEFFFALPYDKMDICLHAVDHGISAEQVAAATGLTVQQLERVLRDIDAKRRAAVYLHERPLLIDAVAAAPEANR